VIVFSCSTLAEIDILAKRGEWHVAISLEEEGPRVDAFRHYVGSPAYHRGYVTV